MRRSSWLLSEMGNVLTAGSVASDSGGGATSTLTAGSDIPCRIDALGGAEGEVADRISDRSTHLVTLPAETTITAGNDFSIDNIGTFEVLAVRSNSDELHRGIEVVQKT